MSAQAKCRLDESTLEIVLDLGKQPLGNGFLTPDDYDREYFYSLKCGFSAASKLFQLVDQPAPEAMFHHDYAFVSGSSQLMQNHFSDFANSIFDKGFCAGSSPFVVEIGSNDGILLRHFAGRNIRHVGIEPSGSVAEMSENRGINVLKEFFSSALAERIVDNYGKADVVMASNVLCHIPDIRDLARGVATLLKADGVLVFEDPYLGDVLRLGSYDQIYDEHVFLFSALSVQRIFESAGMEILDVQWQPTHGGSMRYTLGKKRRLRASSSVEILLLEETAKGLGSIDSFRNFGLRVAESALKLKSKFEEIRNEGGSLAAYGATSKSTTIYNYAGIGPDLVDYVCDNTESKQGKFTPGSHIPIVPEVNFSDQPPDYAFLAAWNHEYEVRNANVPFEQNGGKWISHVPEVRVID